MIFNWGTKKTHSHTESIPKKALSQWFKSLWRGKTLDESLLKSLKESLLLADFGVSTTQSILDALQQQLSNNATPEHVRETLVAILTQKLQPSNISPYSPKNTPEIVLLVGVNGAGKTTTAARIAYYFSKQHKRIILAAGDTFRAAAIDQLQAWGKRLDIPVIAQNPGSDSASVLFDAYESVLTQQRDLLIADTAGRMHNHTNLMHELNKIIRVLGKKNPKAPHETWLVLDATVGQNGLQQALSFHEHVPLTGLVLTKMDGSAKGGIVFALSDKLNIPIRFVGVGEKEADLIPFNIKEFIEKLIPPLEELA